jgi:hypothetical protein
VDPLYLGSARGYYFDDMRRALEIYLVRITNLLNNLVDFLNGQFDHALVHPFSTSQLLNEHLLDIRHYLITKDFGFLRERLLYKEST